MKQISVVVAVVVLLSMLVGIIGCGGEATPTSGPTLKPQETTEPTQPTEQEPIILKYGDYRAHRTEYWGGVHKQTPWMVAVEEVTDGRIVIDAYPSGSLVSYPMAEIQCGQGIADLVFNGRLIPGTLPLMDIMKMPPLYGETTATENLMVYWFKIWNYMDKDYKEMNLIDIGPLNLPPYYIVTAKKPVNGIDDIKGLTLMAVDKTQVNLMSGLGAIVVPISNLDGFEALQKGIADGGQWNIEGPFLFHWVDAFNPGYIVDCGGITRGGGSSNVIMNREVHDSLPQDLQETFDYLTWRWTAVYFAQEIDQCVSFFLGEAERRGIQLVEWSAEEKAKLVEAKTPLYDAWIEEMEELYGRGDDAAEVVQLYHEAASSYVPPAPVPTQPESGGSTQEEWDAVWGQPDSTWGMGYQAYPNQTGLHELEGNEFKSW